MRRRSSLFVMLEVCLKTLIFVCFVYILAALHGHNLAFHPFRPLISDNLSLDKFHILASVNPIHLHL